MALNGSENAQQRYLAQAVDYLAQAVSELCATEHRESD